MAIARTTYIDRIRIILTTLVIFHHTAIVYGGSGGWYWKEAKDSSSMLLLFFNAINQSYFMGFFFLLSGYFVPAAYDRKGAGKFLADRLVRLGIPLVVYFFLISPMTIAIARTADGHPFWAGWWQMFQGREFGPGPLWFAEALLIFALTYVVWRMIRPNPAAEPPKFPDHSALLFWAVVAAVVSFAVRFIVPVGENVLFLQLGYFPPYIVLFIAGCLAWRGGWFEQVTGRRLTPWAFGAVVATVMLPVAIFTFPPGDFHGGWSLKAAFYALWDPILGWGMILGYLWFFQKFLSGPSRLVDWTVRRAYGAYIVHPPVLVGLCVLAHAWVAPQLLKFLVVGAAACLGSWAVASVLLLLPGSRRVL